MKQSFVLIALVLTVLVGGVFVGCDDSSTSSVDPGISAGVVTSIEVRVTHSIISGRAEDERTETITAIARNAAGVGVPGVSVQVGIRNPATYKGSIASVSDTTDANGQVTAQYSVVLEQDADVTIFASYNQVSAEKTIQLIVVGGYGNLSLEVGKKVLNVPPDQSKSTTVTATLTDSTGLAVPGVQINFSTNPALLGFVDSDTAMTNTSGRAVRQFTSIANRYGVCEVQARISDETIVTETIEIRPVAGPDAVTIHADPEIMKVEQGENAQSTIMAVVTDSTGVGVPQTTVLFELEAIGDDPIFGSLTSVDTTTNNDGEISTTFNSHGRYGQQWVLARVVPSEEESGETEEAEGSDNGSPLKLKVNDQEVANFDAETLTAKILITVEQLRDAPRSMTINATPDVFNITPDSTARAVIEATVRDQNRNGIPNLRVEFSTDKGTLAQPTNTDSSGVAQVEFFLRPSSDMDIDGGENEATATITATIPGTGWTASANIEIILTGTGVGSLTLEPDRRFIWADGGGLSYANLTAILQDEDGQILAGEPIVFTSSFPFSVVQSPVTTDSLGRAMTVFDDVGRPSVDPVTGLPDSVLITARYDAMSLTATTRIMIRERNPVSSINLHANARQLTANSGDSTAVRATCYLNDGSPAPAGTEVHFEAIYGAFTEAIVPVAGGAGAAETFYIAGNQVTTDTMIAFVWTPQDTAISNQELIDLVSGPPAIIVVRATPSSIMTNDPTAVATVTATVMDTSGNPVRQGHLCYL